jgi:hypothetical protein
MKPFEIRAKLKEMGFKEDRYGNMLTPKGKYRIHFNSISLRVEKKRQWVDHFTQKTQSDWQNLRTVYYTNTVIQDGVLRLGTLELKDYAATAVAA